MLDDRGMDPTLTSALRPRTPLSGLLELVPIMAGLLGVLILLLLSFESGRALAGRLGTREQSLAVTVGVLVAHAMWPLRCAGRRR